MAERRRPVKKRATAKARKGARASAAAGDEAHKDEIIRHFEAELPATREWLRATIAELETSKQQLQSVNEDLKTVNAQLNSKLESLERANSDRENLLESTQIATIFLDGALTIRSFTPAITDLFHVRDSDCGRPIGHIATRLAYGALDRDVRKVTRTLARIEQEVATSDGSATYMMRILPHRTADNVITGVVITFIDISERKRSEEGLARLAAIVASSLDAIVGAALDGTITTWNVGAENMYGYTAAEAIGSSMTMILVPDKEDRLRVLLERARRPRIGAPIEMERVTKDGRRIVVASTVSPIRDPAAKLIGISVIDRDVTEQKHAEERRRMLLAELNHRVKNTLATVLSLLRQSLRHAGSMKDFSQAFDGRIRALAKSHDLLAASNWTGADLEVLVVTALAPYRERGDRVIVSGDKIMLNPQAALLLGMILHELATNAAKHGALANERGQVEVSWSTAAPSRRLTLVWTEKGTMHMEMPPGPKGFGLTLIERGLAHELKGESSFEFNPSGIRCTIEVPCSEIEAEPAAADSHRRRR
jgi:two-component system CheB/CheR fusion protein